MLAKLINTQLLNFALHALTRRSSKNIFISIIMSLLIFLLASVLFISHSLKHELRLSYESLPEIIVQKMQGGRVENISTSRVDELVLIHGVERVVPRVWGYYYFQNAGANFSLLGIDPYEPQYSEILEQITTTQDAALNDGMVIGSGVKKVLSQNFYKTYFNFILPSGDFKRISIKGVFNTHTQLFSNDTILLPKADLLEIFGMDEDEATDIVLKVANPIEIDTVAEKVRLLYPDTRVITKNDLIVSNESIFNYKSGIFLSLFIITLLTFFMIVYDKASSISSEEKTEIGILKALGWSVEDILKEKFYESAVLSLFTFLLGITLALFFVYFLNAPLLKNIFTGYSVLKPSLELSFYFDTQTFAMIFFLSVPVFIASVIIPSWKVAVSDVDEAIR